MRVHSIYNALSRIPAFSGPFPGFAYFAGEAPIV